MAEDFSKGIDPFEQLTRYTIGYTISMRGSGDKRILQDIPVIPIETKISEVIKPKFDGESRTLSKAGDGVLSIFMSRSRDDTKMERAVVKMSAKDVFPNTNDKSNTYKICFTVDKKMTPYLHIKDRKGEVKVTPLFELMEQFTQ